MTENKERCPYELHVEEFFGLPKTVREKDEIKTDFGMLVNLIATWDEKKKSENNQILEDGYLPLGLF